MRHPRTCAPTDPSAEQWLALSCATDDQWQALTGVLGRAHLAARRGTAGPRRATCHHDRLDEADRGLERTRRLDEPSPS
jgi:crotonobetainyl-CoA:carnitine CoA-transferase CaiB-like acyl-CoA transferase